jgi:hypothetical protein
VNGGVASLPPRTTVPSQSETCTQTEATGLSAPAPDVRQPRNSTESLATKPCRSRSRSGTLEKLCDTIIAPDRS